MTTDWDTLLAQAQRPTTTVPLCLRGDLLADLARMEAAGQNGSKLAAARKAVKDATVEVKLRGLTFEEFNALSSGDDDDDGKRFAPALLRASLVDVPADKVDPLLAALTAGQTNALLDAAMQVTTTKDPAPLPSSG